MCKPRLVSTLEVSTRTAKLLVHLPGCHGQVDEVTLMNQFGRPTRTRALQEAISSRRLFYAVKVGSRGCSCLRTHRNKRFGSHIQNGTSSHHGPCLRVDDTGIEYRRPHLTSENSSSICSSRIAPRWFVIILRQRSTENEQANSG